VLSLLGLAGVYSHHDQSMGSRPWGGALGITWYTHSPGNAL